MRPRLFTPPDESGASVPHEWQPFDLFACWDPSRCSRGISAITSWPFGPRRLRYAPSHVAFALPSGPYHLWAESTATCTRPCIYRGVQSDGVQLHGIPERISDYLAVGGRVDVYRLSQFWRLSPERVVELRHLTVSELVEGDVAYDFDGAFFAGCRVLKLLDLVLACGIFPSADLHALFCSEMVAALAMRLGLLPVSNCSKFTPGGVLRSLSRAGVIQFHRCFASADDLAGVYPSPTEFPGNAA